MIQIQTQKIDEDSYTVNIETDIKDSDQAVVETSEMLKAVTSQCRNNLEMLELSDHEIEESYQIFINEILTQSLGEDYIERLYNVFGAQSN